MLRIHPDPILGAKSSDVAGSDNWDEPLREMLALMDEHNALGIAAIQIGYPLRMFVMRSGKNILIILNPQMISVSNEKSKRVEGCLSLPGVRVEVKRPERIYASYRAQPEGPLQKRWFKNEEARIFQHEYDHLYGKMINRG